MAFNLRNRSFLTLADFNTREMEYMLDLAFITSIFCLL